MFIVLSDSIRVLIIIADHGENYFWCAMFPEYDNNNNTRAICITGESAAARFPFVFLRYNIICYTRVQNYTLCLTRNDCEHDHSVLANREIYSCYAETVCALSISLQNPKSIHNAAVQ